MSKRQSTSNPAPTTPRVIVYCRVSSRKQEEEGTSLDTQEERARVWCEARGYSIVAVYHEQHTGAELWERPLLSEAREMMRDGAADVLLAYAVDRLSRKQTHLAIVIEEVESASGRVLFVTEDFEQSAIGTFLRNAIAFAAEFEREKIAERTARGMMARMQSGKLKPGPRPLYGYRWRPVPDGTPPDLAKKIARAALEPDPDTAPNVERMFTLCSEGVTLRRIAEHLNADSIPSPMGTRIWSFTTVRRILANDAYRGVAIQNRHVRQRVDGRAVTCRRPDNEHIRLPDGTIPAIVSSELFEAVQERLRRNQREAVRNNRNPTAFLVRGGFVRCGECGCNVRTRHWKRPNGSRRAQYVIENDGCHHRDCPGTVIDAETLDNAVWDRVRALVTRPEIVQREIERLRTDDPYAESRTVVERLLAENMRRRDNLTRALADVDDPDVQAALLADTTSVAQRVRELAAERNELAAQSKAWEVSQERLNNLCGWLETVSANIEKWTYEQKRDLFVALDLQVKLYPASHTPRYEITASLPLDEVEDGPIVYHTR